MKTNLTLLLTNILVTISTLIFLYLAVNILSLVPVFADGTQHVWITNYVYVNDRLPLTDITGIQPTNIGVPISISNNKPFIYQPLYYLLSGPLTHLTHDPKMSVDIMNIAAMSLAGIFIYLSAMTIFNLEIAIIAHSLFLFSSTNFWLLSHRVVEPFIIFLFNLLIYIFVKTFYNKDRTSITYQLLKVSAVLALLISTKISTLPIILASLATILVLYGLKKFLLTCAMVSLLTAPLISFNLSRVNAPYPVPLGVKIVDKYFSDAWWNQDKQDWEDNLDKNLSIQNFRKFTYEQFTSVQLSPKKLLVERGVLSFVNNFSLYPLTTRSSEGYQNPTPNKFNQFFLLLILIFGFLLIARRSKLMITPGITFLFSSIYIFVVIFWIKQPTFRYYIYVLAFSAYFFSYVLSEIKHLTSTQTKILLLIVTYILIFQGIRSEYDRSLNFTHTAMHRQIPNNLGGIVDSRELSNTIRMTSANPVFTPMVEVSYYSARSQVWDTRLFFIEDKTKLLEYLKNYNFDYVVLPFYSGTVKTDNWKYYDAVPSDSTFYKVLNDPTLFKLVEKNNTFTAYKRVI